ncbi:MAG: hypothetical protein KatS3mg105_0219 [Gemmatales bacterium]|nr:MAG: hypothetical protein KatS3mg105_0219 [Gemmatales bacterium]
MRNLILMIGVVLVVFAASATVSYMWQKKQQKPEESTTEEATEAKTTPSGLQPPYDPEAEKSAQLSTRLRNQQEALRAREQRLLAREKHLEIILKDIQKERQAIQDFRKKAEEAMALAEKKVADLERQAKELEARRQAIEQEIREKQAKITEFENLENDRIKQMASIYDAMAAEDAAPLLEAMVESGNLETAVKILSRMRERQAAKLLSAMQSKVTAAQLLEKLKGLKRPETPALPTP